MAFLDPDPFTETSLAPEADVIIVRKAQGLLVSYWDVDSEEAASITPDQIQCQVFGIPGGAFELCIASSTLNVDHIVAGSHPVKFTKTNVQVGQHVHLKWPMS